MTMVKSIEYGLSYPWLGEFLPKATPMTESVGA